MCQREKQPQTLSLARLYALKMYPLRPADLLGMPTYDVHDGYNDNMRGRSYVTQ